MMSDFYKAKITNEGKMVLFLLLVAEKKVV